MSVCLELIPVIDLMQGRVVHAKLGQRAHYRPLRGELANGSSDPLRLADALLNLHPFRRLYVADLDAIAGHGNHAPIIDAIRQHHPEVELWVDSGLRTLGGVTCGPDVPVLGSESLDPPDRQLPGPGRRWVLSLDFREGRLLGAGPWLEQPELWPDDLIVMTLDRVGGSQGPDLERVHALRARAPLRRWHAAGGVRDAADLVALERAGVHGVLLASALHDGRLCAADLRRFAAGG